MIVVNSVTTGPLRTTIQLNWPFESSHNADMALSDIEFDTPGLRWKLHLSANVLRYQSFVNLYGKKIWLQE